jgi:hypothetical protein
MISAAVARVADGIYDIVKRSQQLAECALACNTGGATQLNLFSVNSAPSATSLANKSKFDSPSSTDASSTDAPPVLSNADDVIHRLRNKRLWLLRNFSFQAMVDEVEKLVVDLLDKKVCIPQVRMRLHS